MPHIVAYALVLIAGASLFYTGYRTAARRKAAGLTPPSVVGIAVKALVLTVALEIVCAYLNTDRGVAVDVRLLRRPRRAAQTTR